MRDGLGAVDQNANAMGVGDGDELLHRRDRSKHVRYMRDGHEFRMRVEQFCVFGQDELPVCINWYDADFSAGRRRDHLPRHDVRMVLQHGDDDFISAAAQGAHIALRNHVDAFGRAAHEHDVVRVGRPKEFRHG